MAAPLKPRLLTAFFLYNFGLHTPSKNEYLVEQKTHVDVEFRIVHRKTGANSDDSPVSQLRPSMKFDCLWCRAQVRLGNRPARRTCGTVLGHYDGLYRRLKSFVWSMPQFQLPSEVTYRNSSSKYHS